MQGIASYCTKIDIASTIANSSKILKNILAYACLYIYIVKTKFISVYSFNQAKLNLNLVTVGFLQALQELVV